MTIDEALSLAGQRALTSITRLWNRDIIDPPIGAHGPRVVESLAEINRIIVRNGWGKPGDYKGNGSPQWCGMTAGDAWADAGLDPAWLAVWFASTDRLVAWASYQRWNEHKNPKPFGDDVRRIATLTHGCALPFEPRAGDIVIVGNGARAAGNHVTICASYDPGSRTFFTVSGNGYGLGPHGDKREGVVRSSFPIDGDHFRAMFVIRPAFADLRAERE